MCVNKNVVILTTMLCEYWIQWVRHSINLITILNSFEETSMSLNTDFNTEYTIIVI